MTDVLQTSLPYDPLSPRPLPGIAPLDPDDWLIFDEAFAGQMAERDRLLSGHPDAVLAMDEGARFAAEELLDAVLARAYPQAGAEAVRRDGVRVEIRRSDPLGTVGRLVQQDFCILQKCRDEHMMTGAVLCFPASWRLDEKFMRPLSGIHAPVGSYDAAIAKRVQRLFDGVRVGRPLWRFNTLWYDDAVLHRPERREEPDPATAPYLRSERQSILRLPGTGAVVFAIHTFILARTSVGAAQR
jgi:hypothetical protein